MSIFQTQTNSFKNQLFQGMHAFDSTYRPADTFMIALYTNQAQMDATTAIYTSTNEVVGPGYTAGGMILTVIPPANTGALTGGVTYLGFQNAIWTPATFTANSALIYNATQGGASVCTLAFGLDVTCLTIFTVTFPLTSYTQAILRYQ